MSDASAADIAGAFVKSKSGAFSKLEIEVH
jgi:hypothetical protein